ncbi:hypothetical protein PG995_010476 [Apiospora arundinis]
MTDIEANAPRPSDEAQGDILGYGQFAELISSHPSFFAFRRFAALRARMILRKQDRLAQLEGQLEEIDRHEPNPIYRCSYRRDKNPQRIKLFEELDLVMAQYGVDDLNERTRNALGTKAASPRDVQNIRHWVQGSGCVDIVESDYLTHGRDLIALGPAETDDFLQSVGHRTEDVIIWISGLLGRVS